MVDKKLLEVGFEFHGYKCLAMPLGLRCGERVFTHKVVKTEEGKICVTWNKKIRNKRG